MAEEVLHSFGDAQNGHRCGTDGDSARIVVEEETVHRSTTSKSYSW